jgi:RNA polymerase sigma-70 factor (ECF subfamily)
VHGTPPALDADASRQRRIVEAFLAASRNSDFEGLLAVLAPDVVVRADEAAQRLGSLPVIRGATAVAESFKGRAHAAKPALVDGEIGVAVVLGGALRVVLRVTLSSDRIATIDATANAAEIETLDVEILDRN